MPTWRDRVRKGAYISPSGSRIEFDFEDVSRETELRNTAFEFPGVEGAFVQQHKRGSQALPLRCYFSGPQCDLAATVFEEACFQKGIGRLEHPLYGTFDVVPVGQVKRNDNLVAAANQTVVEVSFWPTLRAAYPSAAGDPTGGIEDALAAYKLACASQFAERTSLGTLVDQAQLRNPIQSMAAACNDAMGATASLDLIVSQDFADALSGIVTGIDSALTDPESLGSALVDLIMLPADAVSDAVMDAVAQFTALADAIMDSIAGNPEIGLLPTVVLDDRARAVVNAYHAADLMASSCVAAAVSACATGTFESRQQATDAAQAVVDLFDTVVAWRDGAFADIYTADAGNLDTGETYQALHDSVALTAGYLVEVSFELLPQRVHIVTRRRTFLDLAGELYGKVDNDTLDRIVNENNLTGDEIVELQPGREILYYKAA